MSANADIICRHLILSVKFADMQTLH